jgi:chemotaxis protein CheD
VKQIEETEFIDMGEVLITARSIKLLAVTGSNVVVCLWDRRQQIGGICNFRFPRTEKPGRDATFYGNAALLSLIKIMRDSYGTLIKDIDAHIIGGASKSGVSETARDNIKIAESVVSKFKIRIVSEDCRGHIGRKIVFDVASGTVGILKVNKIRDTDWL